MDCNTIKWNICKISHTNSFEATDLKKNMSGYWTEGPQLYKHPNHNYNYFSTEHENTKNWITKLFISVAFFPTKLFIRNSK